MYCFLMFLCLGGNPDIQKLPHHASVAKDLARMPAEDKVFIRHLTLHHIEAADRASVANTVSYVLNSISRKKIVKKPKAVDYEITALRVDLRDYGISPEAWDKFCKQHPGGQPVRADWFVVHALRSPNYYDLLGVNNLKQYYDLLHHNPMITDEIRGIVTESKVARNNRAVSRLASIHGPVWVSYDVLKSVDNKDLLNNFLSEEYDSREFAGFMSNGLIAYFVADAKGNRLDMVDPRIASGPSHVASSCVSCHVTGIMSFKDSVRSLTMGDVAIKATDRRTLDKILDLFGRDIDEYVKEDQAKYAQAVKNATGGSVENLTNHFRLITKNYEMPLGLEKAAREVGMSTGELKKILNGSNDAIMLNLLVNNKIRRDSWEHVMPTIMKMR